MLVGLLNIANAVGADFHKDAEQSRAVSTATEHCEDENPIQACACGDCDDACSKCGLGHCSFTISFALLLDSAQPKVESSVVISEATYLNPHLIGTKRPPRV